MLEECLLVAWYYMSLSSVKQYRRVALADVDLPIPCARDAGSSEFDCLFWEAENLPSSATSPFYYELSKDLLYGMSSFLRSSCNSQCNTKLRSGITTRRWLYGIR